MKRLLLTLLVLGMFGAGLIGCHAEGDVHGKDISTVPVAR